MGTLVESENCVPSVSPLLEMETGWVTDMLLQCCDEAGG
jgi:hypothetical protein